MIVGVGASAGGLSAFETFLRGIPSDDACAYVLVQHLDPTHESELPGILQRVTSAGVHPAEEGMTVETGQVYVIPSGQVLTIDDGVLHLVRPEDGGSVRTPIDTFLRSLADDQGSNAACVILSGTGTDGALGLKAVKENGGICLVQDPDEAQYDGMPRAAIASTLVDVVGPAGELGERLAAYRRTTPALPSGEAAPNGQRPAAEMESTEEQGLEALLALLRAETGLDFSSYKEATIWRRVRHRMQLLEVQSLPEYVAHLEATTEEGWTLAREFLISVTNFFRDAEAFDTLASRCIPHLFADKTNEDTIRVWVPGCATGEEAYSLLMLLMEHRSASSHKPSIQLFATDIDEQALRHAQTGFYPPSIQADVSEERLRQFFTREDGGYRIRPELRESILFAKHNLLSDPPFSDLDLVSCRNVLIYLKPEMQAKVLMMFHYALKEETYLFLGQSETPTAKEELYAKVENAPHLYRARRRETNYPYPLVQGSRPQSLRNTPVRLGDTPEGSLQVFHRRLVTQRFVPPSVLVDDTLQIVHMIGAVGRYLQIRPGPPSSRIVDVIVRPLRGQLRAALFSVFNRRETATMHYHPDDEPDADPPSLGPITVTVEPVAPKKAVEGAPPTSESYALITFEDAPRRATREARPVESEINDPSGSEQRLKEELQRTRHRLEVVSEEYETSHEELLASNEELQSANEELRSTMEELQTSREELQSANEELVTVNQELKAKIKALNQRNSDIQNLMEATDVGTLFLNRELELRRYTARVTDFFHVIPEDLGRPLSHLTHEFPATDLAALAEQVLDDRTPITRDLEAESGDWYKLRVRPYRTVEEEVDGVLFTFFDITDLKEAERRVEEMNAELEARVEVRTEELEAANDELQTQIEEVERARTRFQKLFQLGPVAGVITALQSGVVQNVNERYCALTGYDRDELVGKTLVGLGVMAEATHERLTAVLGETGQLRNDEVQITTKTGETLQMMVSNEVIGQNGTPMVLSLGVNITARKEAEEALREAKREAEEMNQLKTSFIANMSHEIRTPLTGIIGFAEILEEEVKDEAIQRHVHYIRSNGRRLLETLDSVLDLARLDAEQIHLDPSPVVLEAFAEETIALFRKRAEEKGLNLRADIQDALPQVQVDESALQRILTNLIGNALKFTETGEVTLSIALEDREEAGEGRYLLFEVEDTGIGMEEDFLGTLFHEFTQEQTGMTRSHEGAGLGLAITRRLVGLMKGAIHVDSTPGGGTTFIVRVPYEPVVGGGVAAEAVIAQWGEGEWEDGPRRVLVIDDRPEVGVIVEEFLEDCVVVKASSAPSALDRAAEVPFDLALVDIQLGDGPSGMDLLPDLRQTLTINDASRPPIIAMTAHSLPGDQQRFLDEGFDHYLSKPFTRSDLRRAVAQVLRSPASD
jgi:two-component system CheB/CheR fusion protein